MSTPRAAVHTYNQLLARGTADRRAAARRRVRSVHLRDDDETGEFDVDYLRPLRSAGPRRRQGPVSREPVRAGRAQAAPVCALRLQCGDRPGARGRPHADCGRNPPAVVARRRGPATQSEARANPVADALIDTIAACKLPVEPLLALIEARSFDLYDDPMPSLDALYGYVRKTSSTLIELAAVILGGADRDRERPRRGRPGSAPALRGCLQAFPIHAAHGRLYRAARPARPLRRRCRRCRRRPGDARTCARRCPICGGARASSSTQVAAARDRPTASARPAFLSGCACPFAARSLARPRHRSVRSASRSRSGAGNGRCGAPRATSRAGFRLGRAHSA